MSIHDVVSFLAPLTPEMALVGLLVMLAVVALFVQEGLPR